MACLFFLLLWTIIKLLCLPYSSPIYMLYSIYSPFYIRFVSVRALLRLVLLVDIYLSLSFNVRYDFLRLECSKSYAYIVFISIGDPALDMLDIKLSTLLLFKFVFYNLLFKLCSLSSNIFIDFLRSIAILFSLKILLW